MNEKKNKKKFHFSIQINNRQQTGERIQFYSCEDDLIIMSNGAFMNIIINYKNIIYKYFVFSTKHAISSLKLSLEKMIQFHKEST